MNDEEQETKTSGNVDVSGDLVVGHKHVVNNYYATEIVGEPCPSIVAEPGEERTIVPLLALRDKIRLKAPPSYQTDTERLDRHTDAVLRRLNRFTTLAAPEGPVKIERPVVSVIAEAARESSFVVTGEPGAGKSAVLHAVALVLRPVGPVVTLTVEVTATSLDALRVDLGLEHPLLEVLEKMPGKRPAFLVLDALDGARGSLSESTYKQLLECVMELPGWHVLASVRTFDLRMGMEWKRLFAGRPISPEYEDPRLTNIRHVHVPLLTPDEVGQLDATTPSLVSAISVAGTKLTALARNLFNLALLGDLLCGGTAAEALSKIATRGDLLERFWDARITNLGLETTVALAGVVKRMLSHHAVDLAETAVDIGAASTLQELQRVGVLVAEPTRRIGFRHHVLFDYAVARLVLIPDRAEALTVLSRSQDSGLLVSASLGYWLEHVKETEAPDAFWTLVSMLTTDPKIDSLVRVESARLAVEGVSNEERLDAVIAILQKKEEAHALLSQLSGALSTRRLGHLPISPAPWAALLGELRSPCHEDMRSLVVMLELLIECDNLSEGDLEALGKAARTLFDAMGDTFWLVAWRARSVVPLVARTYGTNPTASRARLQQILEPERFRVYGYLEMPFLADKITEIAESDPDFAVRIFHHGFKDGDFTAEQKTTLSNSFILGLMSNARQDFEGTSYALARAFPSLLAKRPQIGLRALGATLQAICAIECGLEDKQATVEIPYGRGSALFTPDHSAIWAWNIDGARNHDIHAQIFLAFLDWASGPARRNMLRQAPDLILGEGTSALAWRALFQAGACRPAELGVHLWQPASAEPVLKCQDTRKSAIDLIAATYPHISRHDRIEIEQALLRFDFSSSSAPQRLQGRVFALIGEAGLETQAARSLLAKVREEGLYLGNDKPFDLSGRSGRRRTKRAAHEVDVPAVAISPLIQAVNDLTAATKALETSTPSENLSEVLRAVEVLEESRTNARKLDDGDENEACDSLAAAFGLIIRAGLITVGRRSAAIGRLLELSRHRHPLTAADTEENFANSPSWGSPSVRISVARELAEVVSSETWPEIGQRVGELLLKDPHPAVRFQLMQALPRVEAFDKEAMWHLVARCIEGEQNPSVLARLVEALTHLRPEQTERLEPFVLRLAERFRHSECRLHDSLTHLLVRCAVEYGLQNSEFRIHTWIADYVREEKRLIRVLDSLRSYLMVQSPDTAKGATSTSARCSELIWRLVDTLTPRLQSWIRRGGGSVQPAPAELSALVLFRSIGEQLYYAVGPGDALPRWLEGVEAKRAFLKDQEALISRLSTLGDPGTVHQMLHLIGKLLEVDPARCFDLFSDAMLRSAGLAHYEHESLGAKRFVDLVSRYLADFRSLFEDRVRRRKLMDCIAVFVDAGWPEARSLFQSLPELVQ